MNILLTGGQGFIGSNVANQLGSKYNITRYTNDIRNFNPYNEEYDLVVHLAALVGVRSSWKDPEGYWSTNVTASKQIFEWADRHKIRVLYASSSSVHEWWLNPYAASKKAMEAVATGNTTGMRFHTVWGDNSRSDMFYDMLIKGKLEYVTTHERDFTHVNDIVSAINTLINTKNTPDYIDVGTGTAFKVNEIAEKYGFGHLPVKITTGERLHTLADNTYLRSLGWAPTKYII